MQRRDFLNEVKGIALAAAAASVAGKLAFAAESPERQPGPGKYAKLAETAAHCAAQGEVCTQHCIDQLAAGNTSMAACAKATYEMTAVCEALSRMARAESKHLKAMAKIAADVCKGCETECRKHEGHSEICKSCADSCASCFEQCKMV